MRVAGDTPVCFSGRGEDSLPQLHRGLVQPGARARGAGLLFADGRRGCHGGPPRRTVLNQTHQHSTETGQLQLQCAASQPGHLGGSAGLVDEHQAGLRTRPGAGLRRRAAPARLGALFLEGHAVTIEAAPYCAGPERGPMPGAQQLRQLDQADYFCADTAARITALNASM